MQAYPRAYDPARLFGMPLSTASSSIRIPFTKNRFLLALLALFVGVWGWTLFGGTNFSNWVLENIPVVILLAFLVGTYHRFRFSDFSYGLMGAFLMLHLYGAQWAYPRNPLGEWLQEQWALSRNPYDRLVHLSFGFLLTYPLREICLRGFRLPAFLSLALAVVAILALSAIYEVFEWILAALLFPNQGPAFLGLQGDEWDAQKDMALAFLGSVVMIVGIILTKRLSPGTSFQFR
jgi:putative membrane protein